jgi:hypothetical protein
MLGDISFGGVDPKVISPNMSVPTRFPYIREMYGKGRYEDHGGYHFWMGRPKSDTTRTLGDITFPIHPGKKGGYPNVGGYHFFRGRPEKVTTLMLGDITFSPYIFWMYGGR